MSMATAKHHEDLVAWQLNEKLRQLVVALTARSEVRRHVRFCDQILRSPESAPSNIAEGFGRFKPREFARFVRIALGSLSESQNHLRAAVNDKKIPQEDFDSLWSLATSARRVATKLHSYLRRCPDR